jgi:hypothetical protein
VFLFPRLTNKKEFPLKETYIKYSLIVSSLITIGWLSLWLPVYYFPRALNDDEAVQALMDYSNYVILALAFSGLSLLPILLNGLFIGLKRCDFPTHANRLFLLITSLPAFCLAALNFNVAIDGIVNLTAFLPAALLHLGLMVYLILGFPRKHNQLPIS